MDRSRTIGGLALLKVAFIGREEETAILDSAIEMLKEQEPIKPRYETIGVDKLAFCGNCDTYLGKVNFCPKCGKKVKWA